MSQPALKILRPDWRKSAFLPLLLGRVAVLGGAIMLGLTALLLFIHGEVSADALGPQRYQQMRIVAMVCGALMIGGLGGGLVVQRWQHAQANRAINTLVAAGGKLPDDEIVCLYLRSFAASQTYGRQRNWRLLVGNRVVQDPETDLDTAIGDRCTLVAIGDRYDQRGALKLKSTDAQWEVLFRALAARARLIFCFIGPTPASRLEIAHVLASADLFEKTVFIIPPEFDKRSFEMIRVASAELGISLPHHAIDGVAFRPARGPRLIQIIPYADMMKTLHDTDLQALDVRFAIWRNSPFFNELSRGG